MNAIQKHIYSHVLEKIVAGTLKVDDRIETEVALSRRFRTNRSNAHLAVKELERNGMVRRNKKRGTVVCRKPTPYMTRELKSLVSRKLCVLNHCPPKYRHLFWNEVIIESLEERLTPAGIEMSIKNVWDIRSRKRYVETLRQLAEDGVTGLLLIPNNEDDLFKKDLFALMRYHQHVFIFNRGTYGWRDWPFHSVSINPFADGCKVGRFLFEKGYERVAFCAKFEAEFWPTEIARGLKMGVARAGGDELNVEVWLNERCAPKNIHERLLGEQPPDVIVTYSSENGAELIDFLGKKGMTVGDDYRVFCFDNNPEYRHYNLTTAAPSLRRIGDILGKLIVDNIGAENQTETYCVKVESDIIERSTC